MSAGRTTKTDNAYAKLVEAVWRLEQDPRADPALLAAGRKAIADYEALPRRLRRLV